MLWWKVIIYIFAAYIAFSSAFTPIITLIVSEGLRKQAGFSKSIWNIICVLAANIVLCKFVPSSELIIFLVCTLVGEIILWIILTIIIKKQVIAKLYNYFFAFCPLFKSGLTNFLLQPLFWLNSSWETGFFKIIFIPFMLIFLFLL